MYMTSALSKSDVKAVGLQVIYSISKLTINQNLVRPCLSFISVLKMYNFPFQMALELMHEKENKDVITGLKSRTNAGRPNWKEVFAELDANKKGKVRIENKKETMN